MTTDPLRPPAWWARAAVSLATYLLPAGEVRLRYRLEIVAELWGLSGREQLSYVVGVLGHGPALTHALRAPRPQPMGRPVPLHCRVGMFHRWHRFSNEDGGLYYRCLLCGNDRYRSPARPGY